MRGKGQFAVMSGRYQGITPAYAGKRQKGKLFVFCLQDHPRLCGEKTVVSVPPNVFQGSPPPMRGKVTVKRIVQAGVRITPAYAGKSLLLFLRILTTLGSPPPMRGKGQMRAKTTTNPRITPAYAGKSFLGDIPERILEDHPRLCGEKVPRSREYSQNQGSPPPMRGKA